MDTVEYKTANGHAPRELLELAREAFGLSLSSVRLGFLHGENAPRAWSLSLSKHFLRRGVADGVRLGVNIAVRPDGECSISQLGDREPWNYERVKNWLREPVPLADGGTLWSPTTGDFSQRLLSLWPLFRVAYTNGWTMEQKVLWFEGRKGSFSEALEEYPTVELHWSAINYFFNTQGHSHHRSTGAPAEVQGSLFASSGDQISEIFEINEEEPHMRPMSYARLEGLLSERAPWFTAIEDLRDPSVQELRQ